MHTGMHPSSPSTHGFVGNPNDLWSSTTKESYSTVQTLHGLRNDRRVRSPSSEKLSTFQRRRILRLPRLKCQVFSQHTVPHLSKEHFTRGYMSVAPASFAHDEDGRCLRSGTQLTTSPTPPTNHRAGHTSCKTPCTPLARIQPTDSNAANMVLASLVGQPTRVHTDTLHVHQRRCLRVSKLRKLAKKANHNNNERRADKGLHKLDRESGGRRHFTFPPPMYSIL